MVPENEKFPSEKDDDVLRNAATAAAFCPSPGGKTLDPLTGSLSRAAANSAGFVKPSFIRLEKLLINGVVLVRSLNDGIPSPSTSLTPEKSKSKSPNTPGVFPFRSPAFDWNPAVTVSSSTPRYV